MHRASILLQLSLCVTGLNALLLPSSEGLAGANKRGSTTGQKKLVAPNGFVTFKLAQNAPDSSESAADKVTRGAKRFEQRFESATRTLQGDDDVAKRENTYTVDTAEKTTVKNSAGIHQDGTDYSYFVQASLGSDAKPLYMLLDTGASTTWVMGSGCTSDACSSHNSFGSDDSDTYEDTGKTYAVEYGTGSVSGHVVTDNLSVAGLSVKMSFGVANKTSDQFSQFPFDGILGLSMGSDTWLTAVKNADLIESNVFGISLSRSADGTNNGEIALGAPNPDKMTGDISYTTIQSKGTWNIPMDDVMVGGKSAGVKDRAAYIDTGTSFVFGPPDDVEALYKMIPGSSSDGGSVYTVPCDSDTPVALAFSGETWAISSKDFISAPDGDGICTGNIYAMEYIAGAWLVGDVFLKNVYSVYDVDQQRIGFAAKSSGSGGSTTESAQGTSTTSSGSTSTSKTSATGTAQPVGLNGHETQTADTPAAETGGATSTDPASSGEKLSAGTSYTLVACVISIMAMVV